MRRGEIWSVNLDPAVGHEQQGFRPVFIASPDDFNRVTGVPIVLPITSGGNFARARGFAVSLEDARIRTTGIIRTDQPRALDLTARRGRRVESVPQAIVDDVMAKRATIFS